MGLPLNQQPRYVIACNFREIRVYDRNVNPLCTGDEYLRLELGELPKNLPALKFLNGRGSAPRSVQRAVSIEAGRIMGQIHNEIAGLYHDPDSEESHHALSVLCTRLMFLMFCEDAGLIEPGLFRDYIASVDGAHLRGALIELFGWLDTDDEARKQEYPTELLARFPYMNGGLFRERISVPQLNDRVHYEILVSGCQEFDWSGVDPTVFGSIFEGALSHDTRRSGGMHYTSPENIHKVIDPLFLDGLKGGSTTSSRSRTRAPAPGLCAPTTTSWGGSRSSTPRAGRATSSPRPTCACAGWRTRSSWSCNAAASPRFRSRRRRRRAPSR